MDKQKFISEVQAAVKQAVGGAWATCSEYTVKACEITLAHDHTDWAVKAMAEALAKEEAGTIYTRFKRAVFLCTGMKVSTTWDAAAKISTISVKKDKDAWKEKLQAESAGHLERLKSEGLKVFKAEKSQKGKGGEKNSRVADKVETLANDFNSYLDTLRDNNEDALADSLQSEFDALIERAKNEAAKFLKGGVGKVITSAPVKPAGLTEEQLEAARAYLAQEQAA